MKRMKEDGSKRRESQGRARGQTKKIIGGILKEEGDKMYEERGAGRKKEGEGATRDREKREGDGGMDIDKSSQPSNRRLPAHNDKQASGSGERGPESPAKQLKYGELQGEREGEGVTGYGKKREGDGGKDIELQRQGEGAKHDVSSQPSSRRYSAHNDVQASGSGVRAQESLAKQLKNGELQEEREGVDDTSDDEKREGNGGKDTQHLAPARGGHARQE